MNATSAAEIVALIEQIGEEMRKPSTLPLWAQHEADARSFDNSPRFHKIGSKAHRAWESHERAVANIGPKKPEQFQPVSPVLVGQGFIPAASVYADQDAGFSLE